MARHQPEDHQDQKIMAQLKELHPKVVKRVDALDCPEALKPALASAEMMFATVPENIWPVVAVDYDRGFVPVPDDVNGRDVLRFMWWCLNTKEADSVHHIYVDVNDCLTVIFMTRPVVMKATAEVVNGSPSQWIIETHLPT